MRACRCPCCAGFDPVGLPTILLYRGGEQVHSLLRLTDKTGPHITDEKLVALLNEYGALAMPVPAVKDL